MELHDLRFYTYLKEKDPRLAAQVDSVAEAIHETLNAISGCYNNYTMHDIGHSLRVASYMEALSCGIDDSFEDNLIKFNPFEITLMLLSALLHDIGMFIRPEDKENIKNNVIAHTNSLTFKGVLDVVNGSEEEAIKEIVRITHAQRIKEYMEYPFGNKTISTILQLSDRYSYSDDIIEICVAHGENYDYLKKMRTDCTKGVYNYNPQYIAVLLRTADYLDLDKQRTPVLWYKMMNIEGFSRDEWEKHFVIHNEKKLKKYIGDKMQVFFDGKSSSAKIHRKYLAYIDELKIELEQADELLNHEEKKEKYLFRVSTKIDDCVVTEGFKYSDLRLNLDYSAITELLMGNNIYGDKRLGLRELIQNSLDACFLMEETNRKAKTEECYEPQITILLSEEKNYVKIKDNGIGMTIDVVKKHFLNIGKSYYKSNEFAYKSFDYDPIGSFGIGFLACFLLSDNVTVKTKYYYSNEVNQIELEKHSEFVVTNTEEPGAFCGTEIALDYKSVFQIFANVDELIAFVQQFFFTEIPITIKDVDRGKILYNNNYDAYEMLSKMPLKAHVGKYKDVCCQDYSTKIFGTIRICETKQKSAVSIDDLSGKTVYLYNKDCEMFCRVDNLESIQSEKYLLIQYATIGDDQYNMIKESKRRQKGKRDAIITLDNSKVLLIPRDVSCSYQEAEDGNLCITLDGKEISNILIRSDLKYYEELVEDLAYYHFVFLFNGKSLRLYGNQFYNHRYMFLDEDRRNILFFNKGVFVRDFSTINCYLPVSFELLAVINYVGKEIALDVSRNKIINGRDVLKREIEIILMEYLISEESDKDNRAICSAMLDSMKKPLKA